MAQCGSESGLTGMEAHPSGMNRVTIHVTRAISPESEMAGNFVNSWRRIDGIGKKTTHRLRFRLVSRAPRFNPNTTVDFIHRSLVDQDTDRYVFEVLDIGLRRKMEVQKKTTQWTDNV